MQNTIVSRLKQTLIYILIILVFVSIGMIYIAIRVKPVTITYLGKDYKVKTLANTVRGLISDKNIYYNDSFSIAPGLETYLIKGQNITISKNEKVSKLELDTTDIDNIKIIKIEENRTTINFEREEIPNDSLYKGKIKIIQTGQNGESIITYKTVYDGNEPIEQIIISEEYIEPIKEIVEVGTKVNNPTIIGNNGGLQTGQSDLDMLARVIYAEARGEPYLGQVAVGAVIVNRVKNARFPNSIYGVIYAPGQFCTVRDGQINLSPSNQAYRAAEEALNGVDPSNGSLYFYNPRTSTSSWIFTRPVLASIGNHNFAK